MGIDADTPGGSAPVVTGAARAAPVTGVARATGVTDAASTTATGVTATATATGVTATATATGVTATATATATAGVAGASTATTVTAGAGVTGAATTSAGVGVRLGTGVGGEVDDLPPTGGRAGKQEQHDRAFRLSHLALPGFTMTKRTTNSTRRLFSRPAAVALVSRGLDELKPLDPRRSLATPWATR